MRFNISSSVIIIDDNIEEMVVDGEEKQVTVDGVLMGHVSAEGARIFEECFQQILNKQRQERAYVLEHHLRRTKNNE